MSVRAKRPSDSGTPQPGEAGINPPGIAVDSFGGAVVDPTKNVLDLVDMSVTRLNDLREAERRFNDAKIDHTKEIVELRAECADEMRKADKEMAQMRETHANTIRGLDADRLEKIRQVDVLAGNTAADRALVAIQTLATVTAQSAETLRAMVASTATTIATQLDQRMSAVTERIAAVEKSIYTGQGKSAVSDPAMIDMIAEIKRVAAMQTVVAGQGEGKHAMWGYVVGAAGFVLTLVGIGSALFAFANR